MTLSKFKALAAKWQKRLNLSDWEIHFHFIPEIEFPQAGAVGLAEWQPEYKIAKVWVSSDRPDDEVVHSLVHELEHIVLEGHKNLPKNYRSDPMYERGLNSIADALLAKK